MSEVIFSQETYCKIILHCMKYPHCSVNGVLLVEKHQDAEHVTFIDAIPLFHLCLHVTPMAEIALTQIEQWADARGLCIAGYYFANESLDDMSFHRPGHRIADKICQKYSKTCMVIVDNHLVTTDHEDCAVRVLTFEDAKWTPLSKSKVLVDKSILDKTSTLLRNRFQKKLIDFDNHLDNISLDWKNEELNEDIRSIS